MEEPLDVRPAPFIKGGLSIEDGINFSWLKQLLRLI